jgi:hypothetical protein
MPVETQTQKTVKPLLPELGFSSLPPLWKLAYKKGGNYRCEAIFPFEGTKREAINRGMEHCMRMDYHFIHVEEFLIDLDKVEKEYAERLKRT